MATIHDVAKEANVSISTVSRVINRSANVTYEKRQLVLAAMEKVGYTISPKKAETLSNSSRIILVISTIMHGQLCSAIREAAAELGYQIIINLAYDKDSSDMGEDTARVSDLMRQLPQDKIAGVILLNPTYIDPGEVLQAIDPFPTVQVGCTISGQDDLYAVYTDDVQGGYDMTSYLIEQGYRKILAAPCRKDLDVHLPIAKRLKGYTNALRDHELPLAEKWLYPGENTAESGEALAKHILGMEERPDAVFCLSDWMAIGCLKGLQEGGVHVPDDIGLAGYDYIPFAAYSSPPLTTVAQSFDDVGEEAVHMLDQLIKGEYSKGRRLFVAHEIIPGGTIKHLSRPALSSVFLPPADTESD